MRRVWSRRRRPHIDIEVTQLRPGEKLYEELTYNPELATSTSNSKVFILQVEEEMDVPVADIRQTLDRARVGDLSDADALAALLRMGFNIKPRLLQGNL